MESINYWNGRETEIVTEIERNGDLVYIEDENGKCDWVWAGDCEKRDD